MTRLTNYAAVWLSLATIGLYLVLFYAIGREGSKFAADWLVLIGSSFMAASTAPAAWAAIRRGASNGTDQFLVSFWLIWTFVLVQRVWLVVTTRAGRPEYLTESFVGGLIATMIAIAAGYGIAAPLSGPTELPRRQIAVMVVAALISGVVAGMAIGVYVLTGWE